MSRSLLPILLRQPFLALAAGWRRQSLLALSMLINDVLFFILWVVFFGSVHSLNGWHLKELALFQGIAVSGVGLAFFLGDGARNLAARIHGGELDSFLLRPKHPLPQLIFMESSAPSLGDIAYGLLLIAFSQPGWEDVFLALISIFCVAGLYISMVVIFQSLVFFIRGDGRLSDELYTVLLILGTIPQHTQSFAMKLVLFTAIPAGFMAIVPVAMIQKHSIILLGAMIAAVLVYAAIAVAVFQRGLRRYTSAIGWKV